MPGNRDTMPHTGTDTEICVMCLDARGISPMYLADDCRLVTDARERRLHSTESRTCVVARTYSSFGDRAFAAAGLVLWNSLPSHLKEADLLYSPFWRSLRKWSYLLTYLLRGASDAKTPSPGRSDPQLSLMFQIHSRHSYSQILNWLTANEWIKYNIHLCPAVFQKCPVVFFQTLKTLVTWYTIITWLYNALKFKNNVKWSLF